MFDVAQLTRLCAQLEDIEIMKGRVHKAAGIISQGVPERPYEDALMQYVYRRCG